MSNLSPKEMGTAQVRIMLDHLGISIADQPGNKKEITSLLSSFKKQAPEKYTLAYDMVVNHTYPKGEEQKVFDLVDAVKLINDETENKQKIVFDTIDRKFVTEAKRLLNGVSENVAEAIAIEAKKYNTVVHVLKSGNSKPKKLKGVVPECFGKLCQLATMRKNIMMVGPAGAGKTFVSAQIAEALGLPYASQSCSAGVTETAFSGRLLPVGDRGTFEYVESDFVRVYEKGGVFLFDEFDAADPNVLVFLNQALANDSFVCNQRIGKTVVKKHKDFVAIAAANTFGSGGDIMYSARNSLDAATLDRFRVGTVPIYYSNTIEESIVDAEILAWGLCVRAAITSHNMQKIMSTRFLKDATDMKHGQDWELKEIAEMFFSDWSKEEKAVVGLYDDDDLVSNFS